VTRYFVIQIIVTLVKLFQSEIPIIFHMDFSIKFSRSGLYQLKHTHKLDTQVKNNHIFTPWALQHISNTSINSFHRKDCLFWPRSYSPLPHTGWSSSVWPHPERFLHSDWL